MPKHILSGLKYLAVINLRKQGHTQRVIAEKLDMHRSTVSHYLNGRNISSDSIEIAKVIIDMCPKDSLLLIYALLKDKDRTRTIIQTCQNKRYSGTIKNSCIGCGVCVDSCLVKAVVLNDLKAQINFEWCCGCLICVEMCPTNSIEIKEVVD